MHLPHCVYTFIEKNFFFNRLEIVVEPWIDGLWDSLKNVLSNSDSIEVSPPSSQSVPTSACTASDKSDKTDIGGTTTPRIYGGDGEEIQATESLQKVQSQHVVTRAEEQDQLTIDRSIGRSSTDERIINDLADSVQSQLTVASTLANKQTQSIKSPDSDSAHCASSGGLKNQGSFNKEDASWREELRTPSMELASTPLTLPTVPPLFVKVLMKTVRSLLGHLQCTCSIFTVLFTEFFEAGSKTRVD